LLDYAANCATCWSVETLQSGLEATCREAGRSSDAALRELLGSDEGISEFWQRFARYLFLTVNSLEHIGVELRRPPRCG
jgi:hypothetical protein